MKKRLIFYGTPEIAAYCLKYLFENNSNYEIVAVVTAPDKPAGRGMTLHESEVKKIAQQLNLNILQPVNLKSDLFLKSIETLKPDIQVVVAFRMLPEAIWSYPEMGTWNLHASLLPNYRGAAPIHWAVMNGETVTGVTTFKLKHEIDTGDFLDQLALPIPNHYTTGDLYHDIMVQGAALLSISLNKIITYNYTLTPQVLNATAMHAPKLTKANTQIIWSKMDALQVYNFTRGLQPFPIAWTLWKDGALVKIHTCNVANYDLNLKPGEIRIAKNQLLVGCANQTHINVLELQMQGKKKMSAVDFINGLQTKESLCFLDMN